MRSKSIYANTYYCFIKPILHIQIIGRVEADPDYLPRSSDFGLNKIVFKEKFCASCPEPFWKIAFLCTEIESENRQVILTYN
jgi:LIM domain kinase 1